MAADLAANMPPPLGELSRRAAIVGIGETDYGEDYRAQRANAPGYEARTVEGLGIVAFERALADSGLSRDEIDGIAVSYTYGGPTPNAVAETLGVRARYCVNNGNIMTGPLPVVCADIAAGKANTVAMIYAVASRATGRQFGGAVHSAEHTGTPSSYFGARTSVLSSVANALRKTS